MPKESQSQRKVFLVLSVSVILCYLNCHSDNITIVCQPVVLFLSLKRDPLSPHVMLISPVAQKNDSDLSFVGGR